MVESLKHAMPTFVPRLISNSYSIQLHGLGIVVLPCVVGDADPQLERITHAPQLARQIWLVYHRGLRNSQRLIVMHEFLLSLFAQMQSDQ